MNTDMNNEEYPRLTPPEVVYEHKDALKKKSAVVIPLWTKVASAAAAVALLFGIFWQRSATPQQELVAELKPIGAQVISTDGEGLVLRNASSSEWESAKKKSEVVLVAEHQVSQPAAVEVDMNDMEHVSMLAELQPKQPVTLASMTVDTEMAPCEAPCCADYNTDLEEMTFIRQGIYAITDGQHDSFYSIFVEGLRNVKIELASAAVTIRSSRYQLQQKVR